MDNLADNKKTASGPETTSAAPPDASSEKSWGDKAKNRVFGSGLYVGFNYFFNTAFSVGLAYLLKHKYSKPIEEASMSFGNKIAGALKADPDRFSKGFFNGVQSLMLIAGGTLLLPVIKNFEDNRHSLIFKTGNALDTLQEALGFGNSASKQNREDYAKIRSIMKSGEPAELSDDERRRFALKHHLVVNESGSLEFKEHKLPWGKVVAARGAAIAAAYVSNFGLGMAKLDEKKFESAANYNIGGNFSVTGALQKILPKKMANAAPTIGGLLVNDTILTLASSSAHYVTQSKLHKSAPDDECLMPDMANDSPQLQKRRAMASAPRGDYRGREDVKRDAPVASPAL